MNTISLLGTEQDPSGYHTRERMQEPTCHLVDCRLNPWHWRQCWQKPTLIQIYGNRYHAAGRYLGNVKHPSNRMLKGPCEIELADPRTGIRGLIDLLQDGLDLILIDHYLEPEHSHLIEVIRLLQERHSDLRILLPEFAQKSALEQKWRIADYPRPVRSYKLRRRYDCILGLEY